MIFVEQRHPAFLVVENLFDVRGDQHLHELPRRVEAFLAGNVNFLDIAAVKIADGTLDQIGFLIDQRRRAGFEGVFADRIPEPDEIIEVALDLDLASGNARRAHDNRHAVGDLEFLKNFLHAGAVLIIRDLAADAPGTRAVGHQYAIAARQRQIRRHGSALVAALFLRSLNQHDLAAFNDFLNFVFAAQIKAETAVAVFRIAAQRFDVAAAMWHPAAPAAAPSAPIAPATTSAASFAILSLPFAAGFAFPTFREFPFGFVSLVADIVVQIAFMRFGIVLIGRIAILRFFRAADFFDDVFVFDVFDVAFGIGVLVVGHPLIRMIFIVFAGRIVVGFGFRFPSLLLLLLFFLLLRLFFLMLLHELFLLGQQRLAVGDRNAEIVGVNFRERQKAVAVAAKIDESGLQRRLDARHLGQKNTSLQRFAEFAFVVVFDKAFAVDNRNPGFFLMGCVNEHSLNHFNLHPAPAGNSL